APAGLRRRPRGGSEARRWLRGPRAAGSGGPGSQRPPGQPGPGGSREPEGQARRVLAGGDGVRGRGGVGRPESGRGSSGSGRARGP
ncbi:unnamed protein product, partial [Rangifer tarandus platyrhynchus]